MQEKVPVLNLILLAKQVSYPLYRITSGLITFTPVSVNFNSLF